ncbi:MULTISPECIES: DUF971 domain-containing protein [Hyphobacterium]|uniref:DUF971 domain-containing protein n=1 Tax=Hyphobacterium vulgare TaxID=1736751 RepID=A0ABV6ZXS4_9PROT
MTTRPWPVKLDFNRAGRALHIAYDDGAAFTIPFQTLREESPSAEVQGHGPGQKVTVTGKENVGVRAANPVGRYAVQIVFDDGHDSGLFTWDYLRELGERNT